jgi:hypothetical protein
MPSMPLDPSGFLAESPGKPAKFVEQMHEQVGVATFRSARSRRSVSKNHILHHCAPVHARLRRSARPTPFPGQYRLVTNASVSLSEDRNRAHNTNDCRDGEVDRYGGFRCGV